MLYQLLLYLFLLTFTLLNSKKLVKFVSGVHSSEGYSSGSRSDGIYGPGSSGNSGSEVNEVTEGGSTVTVKKTIASSPTLVTKVETHTTTTSH